MATSLRQIAEHLDISVATVSRALQSHPRISDETRHRVASAAAQMGYKPRGTVEPTPETPREDMLSIAVLAQFDVDAWESGQFEIGPIPFRGGETTIPMNVMLAGISKAARPLHISTLVHYVPLSEWERIDQPEYQPAAMRTYQIGGVILIGYYPPGVVHRLTQTWPCVSLNLNYPDSPIDCVTMDSLHAIGQLMDRLHGLGHRRIGYLNYMPGESWAQLRHAGYLQSLGRLGLPYDPQAVGAIVDPKLPAPQPAGREPADGPEVQIVLRHYRQGSRITAWVCANDVCAYRLMRDLERHGIRVPEDLSITGFDDVEPPKGIPTVTGARPPFATLGAAAVQCLLERIQKPHLPARFTLFRCEMVPGETVAGPAD